MWLWKNMVIRMGIFSHDVGASVIDPPSGTLTGAITDGAVECLGKTRTGHLRLWDICHEEEIEALKARD